jgi:tetratricopeptide (TPR) repeat protein
MVFLENLLDCLTTEEGRHDAVLNAVNKGFTVRREYVESAMRFYEARENFDYAGKLAEAINELELAIKFYEKNDNSESAAICAEKQGDIDRAINLLATDCISKISAAELAEKHGKTDKAIELFLESNTPIRAGEMAEKHGRISQAINLYEKTGWPFEMYRVAHNSSLDESKKKEIYDRAIKQLEEKEHYHWAADAADLRGEHEQAKELRRKAIAESEETHPLFAAQMADQLGDRQKAQELYKRVMQHFEREGNFSTAADFAKKAGDEKQAEAYTILAALFRDDDNEEIRARLIYHRSH